MVFPTILAKVATHWLFTFYTAAIKLRSHAPHRSQSLRAHPCLRRSGGSNSAEARGGQTVVCDVHGTLLGCASLFPYFMLVAFEGGGLLRALLLLCCFPLVWALGEQGEAGVRLMAFVTFCGLRPRDMDLVARAVLPKFCLERLNSEVYELWAAAKRRVAVTGAPRAMLGWFLGEYMGADAVVGRELQTVRVLGGSYFTGLMCGLGPGPDMRHRALKEVFGGEAMADLGVVCHSNPLDQLLIPYCKEAYVVTKESTKSAVLPRAKYPKPLVFHDGRLAFFPTPSAMLAFFLFLPLGVALAVLRLSIGILVSYRLAFAAGALCGIRFRVSGLRQADDQPRKGVLYVCSHRTLLDPIMLTAALQRPVPAVTYSLSRLSEMISPIKTVRLTRDRARDAETMTRLLSQGDLAVCPEGTTCREPYLLRFSPLFAELADDMVPVALDARVGMLHGTTASGHKWLDPVAFAMNPAPAYRVEFLGRVPREWTRAGGKAGAEVANWVQGRLGDALGFECTGLTRRDKYMMLAGNDGVVGAK